MYCGLLSGAAGGLPGGLPVQPDQPPAGAAPPGSSPLPHRVGSSACQVKLASMNSMLLLCYVFPRIVCEQLLRHLDMSNVLFWGEALSTVRAIVGGVDYKVSHSLPLPARGACLSPPPTQGCRDLMKLLFDRFHRVPRSLPSSQLPALRRGRDLLAYILDRNAALLPAYFAYDEICRHYPDKTRPPHWLLQEAISPLHSSMPTWYIY